MDIFSLLDLAKSLGASDLHLVNASPPMLRIHGSLTPAADMAPLTPDDVSQALAQITTPEERENFRSRLELDFGYTMDGVGRLRCNAAQQRGAVSLAIRLLPPVIPSVSELGLPMVCEELILRPRGLVVVSGPTGSGKSTTLASMIQHLNNIERRHVVTIEDPIEYVHPSINCAITQRELGSDTLSFAEALRHVLRQDPDVILVGEMRDLETTSSAITAAETGHLVLSTLHTINASQTIERIIDIYPCLLYTSPSPRYLSTSRMPSSA